MRHAATLATKSWPSIDNSRARILIIFQDHDMRQEVGLALASAGYDVIGASSKDEALDLLSRIPAQATPVDLLLSEIDASTTGGLDRLSELKRRCHGAQVILIAERDAYRIYQTAMRLGAAAVLSKPVDVSQLVLAIAVRIGC